MKAREEPFQIDRALERVAEAIRPFPPAALFGLREEGHGSLFEQLVACLISIRTRDEATTVIARSLFARARTPGQIAALDVQEIARLIGGSSFAERKAEQIHAIAAEVAGSGADLPPDADARRQFLGVGPKCAHLALGVALGTPVISVDIHVHRVTNRWGYIAAPTPEKTLLQLEAKLPERYAVEINRLLVPFGKHMCTGRAPRCSECPVEPMCEQVGVTEKR